VWHTGIQLHNDAANKRSIYSYLLTSANVQTHMTCKRQYKEAASLAGLVNALWIAEGLLWQPLFVAVQIPRLNIAFCTGILDSHIAGLTEEDLEQMTVFIEPKEDDRDTTCGLPQKYGIAEQLLSIFTKWLVVWHTGIQLPNDAANKRSIYSYLLTSAYVQTHMTCKRQYKEAASLAGLVNALWIAEGLLWQPLFIAVQIPRLNIAFAQEFSTLTLLG